LVNDSGCSVTSKDTIDWWEAFLASDHELDAKTGLVKNGDNKIFLYAQYEGDIPSSRTPLRGRVDLKAGNASKVQKIIWPVIATAAETPEFAEFETAVTESAYSYLRHGGDLSPIPFSRVTATGAGGDEPNYDGLWCCISTEGLSKGDRIEFGSRGVRDFTAKAIWEINK
jgi:hypothetical protein